MATIKRVETMISMHQMDDEDDPKANTVARVVRARRPLPLLTYAKHRQECEPKRVRSFGSFDDLRVPDISANGQARSPHTGPHTTASAWLTPFLEDFTRRVSPPRVPRWFQSPPSAPFNSASDAFELHPDVRSYGTGLRGA